MKKIIYLILVIVTVRAENFEFDGGINFNKPYLFVSLGCNCWQAQALRAYGLRDVAFPFDWLFTLDTDLLIKCLDEKFEHFNDSSLFRRYGKTDVENIYYTFQFIHDWPFRDKKDSSQRYKEQLEFIKKKYIRRINRFDSIRNFKGKVFFMRFFPNVPRYKEEVAWNAHNAINLNNALKRYFPDLNFTLVIVSFTDPAFSDIGDIPGVKEYKVKSLTDNNFSYYNNMYADLLAEFNFIK